MTSKLSPDPRPRRSGTSSPAQGAAGLRVLVVEDDPHLAAALAGWLGLLGHHAKIAADGPAALQAAESDPPDVVLLDIGLPGMDGFHLARRVREEIAPTLPKSPLLIAVTGRGEEADRQLSREAGIDLHLTKPVDPDQLSRVLRRFQDIIL